MRANHRRDTKPEMAVRRLVHAKGLRYRVDARPIPGLNRRADLVFTRKKLAVFIDGCYWHGCSQHGSTPRSNADYWSKKIATNRSRDAETDHLLVTAGWTVIRAWEHETPQTVALRISVAVDALGHDPLRQASDHPGQRSSHTEGSAKSQAVSTKSSGTVWLTPNSEA